MLLAVFLFITSVTLFVLSIVSIRKGMNDKLDYILFIVSIILIVESIGYGIIS